MIYLRLGCHCMELWVNICHTDLLAKSSASESGQIASDPKFNGSRCGKSHLKRKELRSGYSFQNHPASINKQVQISTLEKLGVSLVQCITFPFGKSLLIIASTYQIIFAGGKLKTKVTSCFIWDSMELMFSEDSVCIRV